jgi:hypothetical protein
MFDRKCYLAVRSAKLILPDQINLLMAKLFTELTNQIIHLINQRVCSALTEFRLKLAEKNPKPKILDHLLVEITVRLDYQK